MIKINFYNETDEDVEIYETIITSIIEEATVAEGLSGRTSCNFIFVNNERIKTINNEFRQKDYATDVLTFPSVAEEFSIGPRNLGDVFISVDKMIEQAYEFGHGEVREMSFLAVHGFLHLLGYDHLTPEEEEIMIGRQEVILNAKDIRR